MGFFTAKKLLLIGFIAVLLAVIPLTVYYLQTQTKTRSSATPATILCFSIPGSNNTCLTQPLAKKTGDIFTLDIFMDPNNTNQVSLTKIHLTYDKTKLATAPSGATVCQKSPNESFCANESTFPATLEGPIYNEGAIFITLSTGADITKTVQTKTKIGSVTFKTLEATTTPTTLAFGGQTQISSIASTDQSNENVLSTSTPASITIEAAGISPSPSLSPSPSASPSATPSPASQPPVCTALNVDRTTSGPAPFAITFTTSGNDPDGTINTVTFEFGDGQVQNVTQGSGIGTKTVNVPLSHTYSNPGTFTAKATLTDNTNTVSQATTACTRTITVTQAGGGSIPTVTSTPSATLIPTTTLTPTTAIETPPASISPSGPGEIILGIGALGAGIAVLGAFLFFAL